MTGSTANGLTTIAYGAWPWPVFSIHAVAVVAPAGPPAPPPKAYTVADQGAQHRREIADDLQLQMQQGLSRPRSRPEWVWIVGPGMFGTIIVVSDDVDPRGISRLSTRTNAWRRCLTPHREKGDPEDVPEENYHNGRDCDIRRTLLRQASLRQASLSDWLTVRAHEKRDIVHDAFSDGPPLPLRFRLITFPL